MNTEIGVHKTKSYSAVDKSETHRGPEPEDILNAVAQAQKTNAAFSFSDANLSFKFLDLCVSLGTHVEDKILVKECLVGL